LKPFYQNDNMTPFSSHPNPQAFNAQVWDIARQVPPGHVTTYGQIASTIPHLGTLSLKHYDIISSDGLGARF
jgi:O6-methylguanine-DNA--protein-cysteine methyltransferase